MGIFDLLKKKQKPSTAAVAKSAYKLLWPMSAESALNQTIYL